MEDDFSQSLTPPVSPFMDEELDESSMAWPPCFSCASEKGREEAQALSLDGYISRGVLKRYENKKLFILIWNILTSQLRSPVIAYCHYNKESEVLDFKDQLKTSIYK